MASVERLQHVERLPAAYLADDDAVGSHPKRAPHEIAHSCRTDTLGVGRSRFEAHHVLTGEPELSRILDRDDSLPAR